MIRLSYFLSHMLLHGSLDEFDFLKKTEPGIWGKANDVSNYFVGSSWNIISRVGVMTGLCSVMLGAILMILNSGDSRQRSQSRQRITRTLGFLFVFCSLISIFSLVCQFLSF